MVNDEYGYMATIAIGHARRLEEVGEFDDPDSLHPRFFTTEGVEKDCEIENKLVEGLRRMKHIRNEDEPSEDCSGDPCTCGRDHFVLEALQLIASKYE